MDKMFIEKLMELKGKQIDTIACSEIKDYMLFEAVIGDKRLCWEVAKYPAKGGRCFIMHKDGIDGAGIFPLGQEQTADAQPAKPEKERE